MTMRIIVIHSSKMAKEIAKWQSTIAEFVHAHPRAKLFNACPSRLILLLVSEAYNLAAGRAKLTDQELTLLRQHRDLLLRLACCQESIKDKRDLLNHNVKASQRLIKILNQITLDKFV